MMVAALMAAPVLLAAQATDADTAGWKTYRNESGEYELKYPNTLSLSIPTGKTCTNGECKPIEEVMLMESDSAGGKPSIKSMSFIIQRSINPQHLPIQQWYEALAHRPSSQIRRPSLPRAATPRFTAAHWSLQ
jgi:hypothetical protein